ncbi:MAG: hypothetical protein ACFFD7_08455 [Candidatus Thorarchaeota archaeon]
MNLQYYETLGDKSKEYLCYLIEQIQPIFTKSELELILADLQSNPDKDAKKSKSKLKSFVDIGTDVDKKGDLSKLTAEQFKPYLKFLLVGRKTVKKQ